MRVKVSELQEGCILSDHVYSKTSNPIIAKKTILTSPLIEVLKVYLVQDVSVESTLVDGKPFKPIEVLEEDLGEIREEKNFFSEYLSAVQTYKKFFQSWQSGAYIDISKVRKFFIPLLEKAKDEPSELFMLHHYSTKEDYLFHHSIAVGLLSWFIANKLNLDKGDALQVAMAGLLSDCGMAKINSQILFKKTALSEMEYKEVRLHSTYSYKMLLSTPLLKENAKIAVLQHHERLDGSGYPRGENGNRINLFAKIISVADVFHAMISERLYRSKQSPFKVLEMILQDYFGKFDIGAIKALTSIITNFSTGSKVILSNGEKAEIIFIETQFPTRPIVKVITTGEMIHLGKQRNIHIDEVLKD